MRFKQQPSMPGQDLWADDALDRKLQAEALVSLLKQIKPPATVTVEADYGQGKSFLLERVAREVSKDAEVVRLNAWTDNPFGLPGAAIAGALIDHLDRRGQRQAPAALDNLMRNLVSLTPGTLVEGARIALPLGISLSLPKTDSWRPVRPSSANKARENIKQQIRELHSALNPDAPPRVYCVVDDLDRCRPEQLVEFLESSRHVFDLENWVFVFAVSPDALSSSVSTLFGISSVDAFLRRFIDLRFPLTVPKLGTYLTQLLAADGERVALDDPFKSSLTLGICMASQTWSQHKHANLRDIDRAYEPLKYLLAVTKDDPTILRPLLMSLFFFRFFNHVEYSRRATDIAQCTPNSDSFGSAEGFQRECTWYRDLVATGDPHRPATILRERDRVNEKYTAEGIAILEGANAWWGQVGRPLHGEQAVIRHHRAMIAAKLG